MIPRCPPPLPRLHYFSSRPRGEGDFRFPLLFFRLLISILALAGRATIASFHQAFFSVFQFSPSRGERRCLQALQLFPVAISILALAGRATEAEKYGQQAVIISILALAGRATAFLYRLNLSDLSCMHNKIWNLYQNAADSCCEDRTGLKNLQLFCAGLQPFAVSAFSSQRRSFSRRPARLGQ